jgi:hypothetical protein
MAHTPVRLRGPRLGGVSLRGTSGVRLRLDGPDRRPGSPAAQLRRGDPPASARREGGGRAPGPVSRVARWLFESGGMCLVVVLGLILLGLAGAASSGR